jgi:hypothetical protein
LKPRSIFSTNANLSAGGETAILWLALMLGLSLTNNLDSPADLRLML